MQCKGFTGYFGSGDSLAMFAPSYKIHITCYLSILRGLVPQWVTSIRSKYCQNLPSLWIRC